MTESSTTPSGVLARLLIGGFDRLPGPSDLLLLGARLYAGHTIASAGLDNDVPGSDGGW